MKWLFLLSVLSTPANADLAPRIMDKLALQIPGISTGTTTPSQMHQAWRRYEAVVEVLGQESIQYRKKCYKVFFKYELNTRKDYYIIQGGTPQEVCDYFARRYRAGYLTPSITSLIPGSEKDILIKED